MAKSTARRATKLAEACSRLPVRAMLLMVLVLAAGAALCLATRAGWRALTRRPEFRVDTSLLTPGAYPQWINGPKMTGELRARVARLPRGRPVFDRDLARLVYQELRGCPWIAEVASVRRSLPNSLQVKMALRKPAGVVWWEGRGYMVDQEGYWLPPDLFRAPPDWTKVNMPLIVDGLLRSGPPRGRPWDGPRLAVGARLCEFFHQRGLLSKLDLATVDVTGVGRGRDPEIVLTTVGGAQVKWGKSTVYALVRGLPAPALGVPDDEKLAMLSSKLREYPGLKGIRYLDLRFHGQIVFAEGD